MGAVADAVGPAVVQGLVDGRSPEGLAGVDGDVEVLVVDELEGIEVPARREAVLGSGGAPLGRHGGCQRHARRFRGEVHPPLAARLRAGLAGVAVGGVETGRRVRENRDLHLSRR